MSVNCNYSTLKYTMITLGTYSSISWLIEKKNQYIQKIEQKALEWIQFDTLCFIMSWVFRKETKTLKMEQINSQIKINI